MGINTQHDIGSLVLNGTSGVQLDGLTDLSFDPGSQIGRRHAAGSPVPSHTSIDAQRPVISVTATDIATALSVFALNGLAFPQSTTYTTVVAYLTKILKTAPRSGASDHQTVTVNEGLVVPRQITAQQDQDATISLEVHATYDGTNEPFVIGNSSALVTGTVDEAFTIGKVSINGTDLEGVIGITIDMGIQLSIMASEGDVWPTCVSINAQDPTIEIQTKEATDFATFGLDGTAQGGTDSVVYLRKVLKNGTRVADGTAEHISFTIDDGMITPGVGGGSNNQPIDQGLTITPAYDGTNAIMVINTATAIS